MDTNSGNINTVHHGDADVTEADAVVVFVGEEEDEGEEEGEDEDEGEGEGEKEAVADTVVVLKMFVLSTRDAFCIFLRRALVKSASGARHREPPDFSIAMTSVLLQYGRGPYVLTSAMRVGCTNLVVFKHWHLKAVEEQMTTQTRRRMHRIAGFILIVNGRK